MPGRDALLMNRPGWWRLYGAAGGIVLIALGCLAAGVWMLFFRDQAEPVVRAFLVRPRRWELYGETSYSFYLALLLVLGPVLMAVAVWIARTIAASERRLDEHLSRQRDAEAGRNTRTLD